MRLRGKLKIYNDWKKKEKCWKYDNKLLDWNWIFVKLKLIF